jgi:feruloyl esterase
MTTTASSHDALPACKEDAFTAAAVKACEGGDGTDDGIIADPAACRWDADTLIGVHTRCGIITVTDAAVMNKIMQGPVSTDGRSLWWGLEPGASLSGTAATVTTHGVTTPVPFSMAVALLGTLVQQNPDWDWLTLTYPQFDALFAQANQEFDSALASSTSDLWAFRNHGGKLLIWQGLADPVLFPQATVQYYEHVQQTMGGAAGTDSFARLFLAPGASHCESGAGPAPDDPLAAVVNWVEQGQAPQSIPATLRDPVTGAPILSRPLCAYPLLARYTGRGSTSQARDFACIPSPRG